ncbi:GGDEF domain-containing protein [Desulfofustis glycolicus]|uniref:GGDEF domain-containing protein n=1 Tax=Desulfofustis glycolicus TaxID=51195 RepID=UPI0009344EC3|nr:GGDEF domain-containing protein [Desulfofustis glycolicus]MCB2216476.1 GGDEF domain-containing protein [Desulfobulbaceae bacterium]
MVELSEAMKSLSRTDELTGILNRRGGMDALRYIEKTSARSGKPFSIVLFDIDHFKKINDEFGHGVGDASRQRHVSFQGPGQEPSYGFLGCPVAPLIRLPLRFPFVFQGELSPVDRDNKQHTLITGETVLWLYRSGNRPARVFRSEGSGFTGTDT